MIQDASKTQWLRSHAKINGGLSPSTEGIFKSTLKRKAGAKCAARHMQAVPRHGAGGAIMRMLQAWMRGWAVFSVLALWVAAVKGQPADYGYNFATVGALGNAAYQGPDPINSGVVGRGSVNYEYRIAKTEVSTGQWLEFLNAIGGVDATPNQFITPFRGFWGAVPSRGQGSQYILNSGFDHAADLPVFGISWREAAMYCNWLHNDKANGTTALLTGAYDVSTWGNLPNRDFTDEGGHMPGAKYWLPTRDEQLKAVYYDPNRYGNNQGGWWQSPNKSDSPGVSGPPGIGTTSAGYSLPEDPIAHFLVPLGAYADQTSPWGLFDTSGGGEEWNEDVLPGQTEIGFFRTSRGLLGSSAADGPELIRDHVYWYGGQFPSQGTGLSSFRIASSVPGPSALVLACVSVLVHPRKRR